MSGQAGMCYHFGAFAIPAPIASEHLGLMKQWGTARKGAKAMDFLIVFGVGLVVWIIFQVWVLPRLGVAT